MKIYWIKYEKDSSSFKIQEKLGMNVEKVQNPEDIDERIDQLIKNNCKTIILSNEIAGFSEDIIKKYRKQKDINIIISPRKKE